jgi:hypothetical protein
MRTRVEYDLGREVMADSERDVVLALQRLGQFHRCRPVRLRFLERALRVHAQRGHYVLGLASRHECEMQALSHQLRAPSERQEAISKGMLCADRANGRSWPGLAGHGWQLLCIPTGLTWPQNGTPQGLRQALSDRASR